MNNSKITGDKKKLLKAVKTENQSASEVRGNIEFPLCDTEFVGYDENNGDFYLFFPERENTRRQHLVSIPIEFYGLAEDDQSTTFIDAKIDGSRNFYTFEEMRDAIKSHAVTGSHLEKIVEFLTMYLNDKNVQRLRIHPDGIYIDGGIIKVETPFNTIDIHSTLSILYQLYVNSTSPDNFVINFAYFLIAPLSYYFRKESKLFPFLINSGQAHSGKTSLQLLFGNYGYGQELLKSHFTRNDLKTYYTLMKSRADSILPITLEDVELDWIRFQSTMLKGSAGTTNGGSRGYYNRVLKYESKSQLAFDTNDLVDVETAQLDRFIICNFDATAALRINIADYDRLTFQLSDGFMFSIFNSTFGGEKLSEIIKNIYSVKDRDALKINLLKYVIIELNKLMPVNLKFKLPDFTILHNENNATDWAAELFNLGQSIFEDFQMEYKRSIYELNSAQIHFDNNHLFITASGYSLLQRHLNLPFKSTSELNNNNTSKRFLTKITTHRFAGHSPIRCLEIFDIENPGDNQDKPDIIYRKSMELATDLPIEDSFTRAEWNYYAFDKAKKTIDSKAWIQFSEKSQVISKEEFEKKHRENSQEKEEKEEINENPKNSTLSEEKIQEIKNRILEFVKHGRPSNELRNFKDLGKHEYGLDPEAMANIVKSMISEKTVMFDKYKRHLLLIPKKFFYYKTKDEEALNPVDAVPIIDFTYGDWHYLKLELATIPETKSWRHFIAKSIPITEKEFNTMRGAGK